MPAVDLSTADLAPFADIEPAKAQAMIEDAVAQAALVAPCITDDDFAYEAAAKAVIRGAILRWNEAGSGAVSQYTAGPYGQVLDTRQPRRALFWPTEIEALQKMCRDSTDSGAWSYDTTPAPVVEHADICDLNLGGNFCSCGAIFSLYGPLWENR